MVRALSAVVLVALALPAGAASDLPRRIGMYPTQSQGAPLAMLDSDVTVRVRGPIVEATITQTFKNDTDKVTAQQPKEAEPGFRVTFSSSKTAPDSVVD